MKIYSLSKVLALPFLLMAGFIMVKYFTGYDSRYSIYIFVPVIILVILYIFHGQIDFWWLERHPIPLDNRMKKWFEEYSPYYRSLDEQEKALFENRLSLYVEGREFKSVGTNELKEVPFDLQAIIASQAIKLTANHSDYLLGDMDRIYVYKHAFPSPQYQFLHTFEVHLEDGMILLSTEHALPGITQPHNFYNVAMHAYSQAFIQLNSLIDFPVVHQHGWDGLEQVIGLSKDKIIKTCGYETLDLLAVHITAYMDNGPTYQEVFPREYNSWQNIFRIYE